MNLTDLAILASNPLVPPTAETATFNGTGYDLQPYEGVLRVTQEIGTVSGTTPSLTGKIQSSPDNSTWTDVAGAVFTAVTASTDSQTLAIDTRFVQRYIRYVGTISGTTPSFTMAVETVALPRRLGSK